MTVQEKQLLRRVLIGLWQLLQSKSKTEAIKHVDEIVDAVSDLQEESEK